MMMKSTTFVMLPVFGILLIISSTTTTTTTMMVGASSSSSSLLKGSSSSSSSSSVVMHHRSSSSSTDMLKRMLQKAENNQSSSSNNDKKKKLKNIDSTTNKDGSNSTTTTIMSSTAHYNGILLDNEITRNYIYNTPINVNFEVRNSLNIISTPTLLNLNLSRIDEWEVGVFMRMADPQGGALEPIFAVKPTTLVNNKDDNIMDEEDTTSSRRSLRQLQQQSSSQPSPLEEDEENAHLLPLVPPILNYEGTAKITTTDASTLDPILYGTGFDIYLLDEHGGAIVGPATYYMIPTEAMQLKEQEEIEKRPDHGLIDYDHGKKKGGGGDAAAPLSKAGKEQVEKAKKAKDAKAAKDMGYGSGMDGNMVLTTREALASYILTTDLELYEETAVVTVTYDIGVAEEESRRRKMKNIFGGGSTTTTATTTTTTQATSAAAVTTTTKGTTSSSASVTTTTSASTATTTTKGTKASTTTTTATSAATTTTSGAVITPPALPIIDGENIKLYRLGVYMRMAHPQDGSLAPILSIPLCPTSPCTSTPTQLESGSITFSISQLNLAKYGTGYDIWILDGNGVGIAGPKTFYVQQEEEKEVDGEL